MTAARSGDGPHIHHIEMRRKKYAPVQDVAVRNDQKSSIDSIKRSPTRASTLRHTTMLENAGPQNWEQKLVIKKAQTCIGTKCTKCGFNVRIRETGQCMYCYGPAEYRKSKDAKLAKRTAMRAAAIQERKPNGHHNPPPVITVEEPPTILPDQTPIPSPGIEGEVGLSVTTNGLSSMQCVLAIPLALLGAIRDPKRVIISGTPHEGIQVKECLSATDGLKCNYSVGNNVYVSVGIGRFNLTKHRRKQIKVAAVARDGVIKISGPNYEWIIAGKHWLVEKNPAPLPSLRHIAPDSAEGFSYAKAAQAFSGNGATPQPPPADTAAIREQIKTKLAEVAVLKTKLEQMTGMSFTINRNLQFVAVL